MQWTNTTYRDKVPLISKVPRVTPGNNEYECHRSASLCLVGFRELNKICSNLHSLTKFILFCLPYTLRSCIYIIPVAEGFERPPPPSWKQIITIKVEVLWKLWQTKSRNWWKSLKISFEKQDFPKVRMKCLEMSRLQDFAPNTTGLLTQ